MDETMQPSPEAFKQPEEATAKASSQHGFPGTEGQPQEMAGQPGDAPLSPEADLAAKMAAWQQAAAAAGQASPLPPGYLLDPATGQPVFVGHLYQQQMPYVQPNVVYVQQQPTPEQLAAQQAEAQQRYGQIMQSVEQFLGGEATVSDVVKTLYATTSENDQLWKGFLVGAAAAVLLSNGSVREMMGKSLGGLFPGAKNDAATPQATPPKDKE
ncbi:MAG: hypothetical protein CSA21_07320 [Deltaproteobacteria bacterium]|nr:MAG: hypothetical protein CSA21_07320 [Deltaproteobacteria bacterium]